MTHQNQRTRPERKLQAVPTAVDEVVHVEVEVVDVDAVVQEAEDVAVVEEEVFKRTQGLQNQEALGFCALSESQATARTNDHENATKYFTKRKTWPIYQYLAKYWLSR
jgi:hypothetical protein